VTKSQNSHTAVSALFCIDQWSVFSQPAKMTAVFQKRMNNILVVILTFLSMIYPYLLILTYFKIIYLQLFYYDLALLFNDNFTVFSFISTFISTFATL
jgi:hypothetical protein